MRKPPVEPFRKKRAVIVQPPAFQAGCRGFEPRLPLSSVHRLFAGTSNARWEQPGSEEESKQAMFYYAKRRAATSCLAKHVTSCLHECATSCFAPVTSCLSRLADRVGSRRQEREDFPWSHHAHRSRLLKSLRRGPPLSAA